MKIIKSTITATVLVLLTRTYKQAASTQQCYSVSCDTLEGKCTDKSDLELKITLSDSCCKTIHF